MERHAFLHRRTATLIYNFAQSFGGGKLIAENKFWPLEIDGANEMTFEEYIEAKKKENLPDDHFTEILKNTLNI